MVLTVKDGIGNAECGCSSEGLYRNSFGKEKWFRIFNTSFGVLCVVGWYYLHIQYFNFILIKLLLLHRCPYVISQMSIRIPENT